MRTIATACRRSRSISAWSCENWWAGALPEVWRTPPGGVSPYSLRAWQSGRTHCTRAGKSVPTRAFRHLLQPSLSSSLVQRAARGHAPLLTAMLRSLAKSTRYAPLHFASACADASLPRLPTKSTARDRVRGAGHLRRARDPVRARQVARAPPARRAHSARLVAAERSRSGAASGASVSLRHKRQPCNPVPHESCAEGCRAKLASEDRRCPRPPRHAEEWRLRRSPIDRAHAGSGAS